LFESFVFDAGGACKNPCDGCPASFKRKQNTNPNLSVSILVQCYDRLSFNRELTILLYESFAIEEWGACKNPCDGCPISTNKKTIQNKTQNERNI
jgi:hypothetical protein